MLAVLSLDLPTIMDLGCIFTDFDYFSKMRSVLFSVTAINVALFFCHRYQRQRAEFSMQAESRAERIEFVVILLNYLLFLQR